MRAHARRHCGLAEPVDALSARDLADLFALLPAPERGPLEWAALASVEGAVDEPAAAGEPDAAAHDALEVDTAHTAIASTVIRDPSGRVIYSRPAGSSTPTVDEREARDGR
jgi:hypothetical protein